MKYRKKPLVIDAFQMTRERHDITTDWPLWLHTAQRNGLVLSVYRDGDGSKDFEVKTPEGILAVSENDWIIRGVKGELYPCKPDVFTASYEPVEEAQD